MSNTNTNTIEGREAGKGSDMNVDLTTTEGFTAARAAWKAAGCPANHPYLTAELPAASPVEPLVMGITAEMVELAGKLAPFMPERRHWAA